MNIQEKVAKYNAEAQSINKERERLLARKEVAEQTFKKNLKEYTEKYEVEIKKVTDLEDEFRKVVQEVLEEIGKVETALEDIKEGREQVVEGLIDTDKIEKEEEEKYNKTKQRTKPVTQPKVVEVEEVLETVEEVTHTAEVDMENLDLFGDSESDEDEILAQLGVQEEKVTVTPQDLIMGNIKQEPVEYEEGRTTFNEEDDKPTKPAKEEVDGVDVEDWFGDFQM